MNFDINEYKKELTKAIEIANDEGIEEAMEYVNDLAIYYGGCTREDIIMDIENLEVNGKICTEA